MKIKFVKVLSQILKKVQIPFLNRANDHHYHPFLEYYRHSLAEVISGQRHPYHLKAKLLMTILVQIMVHKEQTWHW